MASGGGDGGGQQGLDVGDDEQRAAARPGRARAPMIASCTRWDAAPGSSAAAPGAASSTQPAPDGGRGAAGERELADALRPDDQHTQPGRAAEAFQQLGTVEGELQPLDEAVRGGGVADQVLDGDGGRGVGLRGPRPPPRRARRRARSASPRPAVRARRATPTAPLRGRAAAATGPGARDRVRQPRASPVEAPPAHPTTVLGRTATAPAGSTSATVSSSLVQAAPNAPETRCRAAIGSAPGRGLDVAGQQRHGVPPVTTLPSSATRTVSGASAARASSTR